MKIGFFVLPAFLVLLVVPVVFAQGYSDNVSTFGSDADFTITASWALVLEGARRHLMDVTVRE